MYAIVVVGVCCVVVLAVDVGVIAVVAVVAVIALVGVVVVVDIDVVGVYIVVVG